jgi:hypothetical protein
MFLLATFGLNFMLRNADGPLGIIARWRNWMMRIPWLGVQFMNWTSCAFCSGIWCAAVIFWISVDGKTLGQAVTWILAGGAACLLIESVLNRLNRE